MSADMGILPPSAEILERDVDRSTTSWTSRLLALLGLLGLAAALALAGTTAHRALSDAWVAPLQLSPDNEKVLDLRIQQTKEKADRARLTAEVAGLDEELRAVDLSLTRMRALSADYRGALAWTTDAQNREMRDLDEQTSSLQAKQGMLFDLLREQQRVLDRAKANLAIGLITDIDFERQQADVRQLEVAMQDCGLDLSKVEAARSSALARGQALTSAASTRADPNQHPLSQMSPEVIKFYDDEVRVELEVARLEAEKRSALARRRATQDALDDMVLLLRDLEARPLYRAMQRNTDLAFVPYEHLRRFAVGDEVYACAWSVVDCHPVGRVSEVVPGEVIAQDPWGELARGQYVVLDMRDRSALFERVLRVRRMRS